jgi:hypothetical protein
MSEDKDLSDKEMYQLSIELRRQLRKQIEDFTIINKNSFDNKMMLHMIIMSSISSLIAELVWIIFKKDGADKQREEFIDDICEASKEMLKTASQWIKESVSEHIN